MCDCYTMICKCRKFYVQIHITDFIYPRKIIKQAYCPYCNYRGPKATEEGWETSERGEFVVDNFLFHGGDTKGDERVTRLKVFSKKRVSGFFTLVFDKKHSGYKDVRLFMEEHVGFNGNPNDVANIVPDCYHYRCRNIEKRKERDDLFNQYIKVNYCSVHNKDIWRMKKSLKHSCKFLSRR